MSNPLKAYFRRPEIYFKLPSRGVFWPDGAVEMPINGELEVYAMTAADEIALRTPDALMNGHATVTVIESCIPAVKDAWHCPTCDLDALLIASRIASVGVGLDLEVNCPNCKHVNEFTVDLRRQLDMINANSWQEPKQIKDLVFHFKPLTFKQNNDLNNRVFVAQKQLQQINQLEDSSEKEQLSKRIIEEISNINTDTMIASIASIDAGGQSVTEPEYIREFMVNTDRKTFDAIKKTFEELRKSGRAKDIDLECEECKYKFVVPFTLDYGSFFA